MKKAIQFVKFLLPCLFLAAFVTNAAAQKATSSPHIESQVNQKKISGLVTDEKGEPIIGATIVLKGSNAGTITNVDGKFSLEVPEQSEVIISYIGFKQTVLKVNKSIDYKIVLVEDSKSLDEVVVVGYGTQKKVNLTGAVTTITNENINGRPVATSAMALQGLDPGLNITMTSGSANAKYDIDIRGVASINGGTPLILVDGIEADLSRLNSNDIQSVTVLKDASSAAIYGAKASSGVVIITTKSGSKTGKSTITYSGRYGISSNTTSTDYITTGYWSAKINDMFMTPLKGIGYTSYDEQDYAELYARINDKTENPDRPWVVLQDNGTYKYYANFDWYNYMYNKYRSQQEHNIAIQGGNDNINYYVSGRFFQQNGIVKISPDVYENYSFRTKIEAKIRPWLKFSTNASFFSSTYSFPGTSSVPNLIKKSYVHALAFMTPTNPDGTNVYFNPNTNITATVMDGFSAILLSNKHRNTNYDREIMINPKFEASITPDFTLTAEYAYTFRPREYDNRSANISYSEKEGVTEWLTTGNFADYYQEQHYRSYNSNANIYGTYNKTFDVNHNVKFTGGFQYENNQVRNTKVRRLDLLSDNLDAFDLATGEVTVLEGTETEYATMGYFGRLNYDYAGKYLAEVSGRFDGSSRFAKTDRWGFFPSASVGWRMSEEPFFESLKKNVDNLKLRLSIGSLGNQQVDEYSYIDVISTNNTLSGYTLDKQSLLKYAVESDPNASNLTWETITTYNGGLDMAFLKNRLTFTMDGYIRNTKDMLTTGMTLPSVYGADAPMLNAADMRTIGWEVSVGWKDKFILINKPFQYSVSASLGDYTTKITKYSNSTNLLTDYYEGMTLGEIWGFKVGGLFASDEEAANYEVDQTYLNQQIQSSVGEPGLRAGDVKFLDLDGDNVLGIGANTKDNPGDRRVIGNSLPRYSYNINLSASWNNIDMSALFHGIGKQDWYPGNTSESFWGPYCRPYDSFIPSNFLDNVWSETNTDAYFPRARGYEAFDVHSLSTPNDRYLQNIAFIRLKNLTLGYKLPEIKNIEQIRVYLSGENLFYISPLQKHSLYIDPEQAKSTNTQDANSGLAYNFSKTISLGVNITF